MQEKYWFRSKGAITDKLFNLISQRKLTAFPCYSCHTFNIEDHILQLKNFVRNDYQGNLQNNTHFKPVRNYH